MPLPQQYAALEQALANKPKMKDQRQMMAKLNRNKVMQLQIKAANAAGKNTVNK